MLQSYSEVEVSPLKMSEEKVSAQVLIPSDKFLQVLHDIKLASQKTLPSVQ